MDGNTPGQWVVVEGDPARGIPHGHVWVSSHLHFDSLQLAQMRPDGKTVRANQIQEREKEASDHFLDAKQKGIALALAEQRKGNTEPHKREFSDYRQKLGFLIGYDEQWEAFKVHGLPIETPAAVITDWISTRRHLLGTTRWITNDELNQGTHSLSVRPVATQFEELYLRVQRAHQQGVHQMLICPVPGYSRGDGTWEVGRDRAVQEQESGMTEPNKHKKFLGNEMNLDGYTDQWDVFKRALEIERDRQYAEGQELAITEQQSGRTVARRDFERFDSFYYAHGYWSQWELFRLHGAPATPAVVPPTPRENAIMRARNNIAPGILDSQISRHGQALMDLFEKYGVIPAGEHVAMSDELTQWLKNHDEQYFEYVVDGSPQPWMGTDTSPEHELKSFVEGIEQYVKLHNANFADALQAWVEDNLRPELREEDIPALFHNAAREIVLAIFPGKTIKLSERQELEYKLMEWLKEHQPQEFLSTISASNTPTLHGPFVEAFLEERTLEATSIGESLEEYFDWWFGAVHDPTLWRAPHPNPAINDPAEIVMPIGILPLHRSL